MYFYSPIRLHSVDRDNFTFFFLIFYRILDAAKPFYLTQSCPAIIHTALHTAYYSDSKLRTVRNSLFIYHELHIVISYSYSVTLKYSVNASHVYVYTEALLLYTADTNAVHS